MKRYAFIYNPGAKGGRSESVLNSLHKRISGLPKGELFRSKNKGDIPDLVEQLKPDFDVFVACGGDGTVREVASPLISSNKVLGILPLGSGNDLCKTLSIPNNLRNAFETLIKGQVVPMDVGSCNEIIFLNSLGFGFDALANRYAHELQRLPGFFRYTIAALKANLNRKRFSVEIKTENQITKEKLMMISFANGRVEGGSFWIAPEASLSDGKLAMVNITPVNRFFVPFLLPLILVKKIGLIPYVRHSEVSSVILTFENTPSIHADGEIIETNTTDFQINVKPGALKVIAG